MRKALQDNQTGNLLLSGDSARRRPKSAAVPLPCHYPNLASAPAPSSSSSSGLVFVDAAGLASALVAASTISLMAAAMARSASAFKSFKSRLVRSFCTALKPPAAPAAGDCRAGMRPPAGPTLGRPRRSHDDQRLPESRLTSRWGRRGALPDFCTAPSPSTLRNRTVGTRAVPIPTQTTGVQPIAP